MGVKNLVLGLPEHGKIKAGVKGKEITSQGGKKFRPPQKLNHYIITTTERDSNGDYVVDHDLMDRLSEDYDAVCNDDGYIIGIPGRLLYNDPNTNFFTRYAKYKGTACVCHGDGEIGHPIALQKTIPCPCNDLETGVCKINGKLHFIIEGASNLGACHVLRTTSINTVKSILGSMELIKAATGGLLAFLPLHLMLTPKHTVIPSTGAPVVVYVSSLVFRGTIEDLQKRALQMAQAKAKYLITMDEVENRARKMLESTTETPEEQKEIAEEFYPEGIHGEVDDVVEIEKVQENQDESPAADAPVEPKPEPPVVEYPEANSGPIIASQKNQIRDLKGNLKISNPVDWLELLKPFGVTSANQLNETQAENFIRELERKAGDDVPF